MNLRAGGKKREVLLRHGPRFDLKVERNIGLVTHDGKSPVGVGDRQRIADVVHAAPPSALAILAAERADDRARQRLVVPIGDTTSDDSAVIQPRGNGDELRRHWVFSWIHARNLLR